MGEIAGDERTTWEGAPVTVRRSVELDAPPAEVWRALTDESMLSEWLAPEVELDLREGGEIACRYEDGEERRGAVRLVEEAERLSFEWWRGDAGPSRVDFTLDAVGERTLLTVVETAAVGGATALAASWRPRLASLPRALSLAFA